MIASAPDSTAKRASSGSITPLSTRRPPQRFLIHSRSSQQRLGSNCSDVHDDSDETSVTFLAWPTMLPNVRRFVPSMFRHQRGLVARLIRLARVGLGGAVRPFLMSLCRWPNT